MKNDKIISAKVFFGGWVMRLSLFERLHGMSSLTPDSSFLRVIFVRETKRGHQELGERETRNPIQILLLIVEKQKEAVNV